MAQSLLTRRLRETALRIQRAESIHLGNLRRLLVEAADALDGGTAVSVETPRILNLGGAAAAGGRARAEKLEPERRREIARVAARARWGQRIEGE